MIEERVRISKLVDYICGLKRLTVRMLENYEAHEWKQPHYYYSPFWKIQQKSINLGMTKLQFSIYNGGQDEEPIQKLEEENKERRSQWALKSGGKMEAPETNPTNSVKPCITRKILVILTLHTFIEYSTLKPHPLPPRFMGYYSNYTTKSIQRKPFECLSNVSTSKLHLTKIE